MSDSQAAAEFTMATIKAHLRAAETALIDAGAGDSLAACETALVELRIATTAHDQHVREVSHDLRNTLTSINGQAQLLERLLAKGSLPPDRVHKALRQINQSVADANAIIRQLSDQ